MKALFPLRLGVRNLFGRNGRPSPHLAGSILGIALSLVPLVVVLEIADGMIEGITRRYLELGTYHAQIELPWRSSSGELASLAAELEREPSVRHLIVERQSMGLLYTPAGRTAVTVRAVPPDLYARDEGFRRFFLVETGRFDLEASDSVLLGREVAHRLRVGVGDGVKLLSLLEVSERRSLPVVSSFTVRGIFTSGYQELDKLWIYIPLGSSERLASARSSSLFIGVKLDDPFERLESKIHRIRRRLPPEIEVRSWYQLEKANYMSFQTTKALLLFIMALIVVVAAVNISSALVMVVIEKTTEIGVLKCMGAGPGDIGLAFLVTGLATGAAGTGLGLAAGVAVAVNVNGLIRALEVALSALVRLFAALLAPIVRIQAPEAVRIFNAEFYLESIPIDLRFGELFAVGAATLLISTLAAFLPARQAGRIRPLEVLRRY